MKILVIGAGAWGTALAANASAHSPQGPAVTLWARDAAQAQAMQATRRNARYLPEAVLPPSLRFSSGALPEVVQGQDLLILASPVAGVRGLLTQLRDVGVPVAWQEVPA